MKKSVAVCGFRNIGLIVYPHSLGAGQVTNLILNRLISNEYMETFKPIKTHLNI